MHLLLRRRCREPLQHTAAHCNTLQHNATHSTSGACTCCCVGDVGGGCITLQHTATHSICCCGVASKGPCNTLQQTTTHYSALDLLLQQCCRGALQSTAILQHAATHCNTLQHTSPAVPAPAAAAAMQGVPVSHCTTLQYTAIHSNTLHLLLRRRCRRALRRYLAVAVTPPPAPSPFQNAAVAGRVGIGGKVARLSWGGYCQVRELNVPIAYANSTHAYHANSTHICIYVYTYVCLCIYMFIHIHMYVYIHMYI